MATAGRIPGQVFVLGDGTEVRVTRAGEMPKRFLRELERRGQTTLRVLSTWRQSKWQFHDDPPYEPWERGGFHLDFLSSDYEDRDYDPLTCTVAVPVWCFEPEVNEYGEVSP